MSDTSNETPPEETTTDTPPEETTPAPADGGTPDGGTTTTEQPPAEQPPAEQTGDGATQAPATEDGTTAGTTNGEAATDPTQPANEVPAPLPEGQEAGAGDVQTALDQEQEQGFRGEPADETPNHAYTVAGVLANEETPESKLSTPV
jgi:hypothetical protein